MMSSATVTTQYHLLRLLTTSDRTDPDAVQMDLQWGQLVSVYPPRGAAIDVRSERGPFDLVVTTGDYDLGSAPGLTEMDREWEGEITLADSTFSMMPFDGIADEMMDLPLDGPGSRRVHISWRYQPKAVVAEFALEIWDETIIVRFGPLTA